MKKLILTRWISGSWKTTWAKWEVKNNWAIRFNKDEIRKEDWLFPAWYFYSKENEKTIYETERERVLIAILSNTPYIIVDNTHLGNNNKHIIFYMEIAKKYWYVFEIKDFYCNRKEAIKRDNLRSENEKVGEDVINKQIKIQWNGGYPKNPTFNIYNEDLRDCIICDIDWTLAFMDDKRTPYEYNKVKWDRCNEFLMSLLWNLVDNWKKIFIVSWRDEICRKETEEWLNHNSHFIDYILLMRKEWDKRDDKIVKWEIYEEYIKNKYNIFAVFDDRQGVIDMWRLKYNLPTYQVWYGNF